TTLFRSDGRGADHHHRGKGRSGQVPRRQRDRSGPCQPVGDQDNLHTLPPVSRSPMRLPNLDRILSAESTLQPLLSKARDLRALAALVERFLSRNLASQARVVNLGDGEMVRAAVHSAAAAKLR